MNLNLPKIITGAKKGFIETATTAEKAAKKIGIRAEGKAVLPPISARKLNEAYVANKGITIARNSVDAVYSKLRPRIIKPRFHPDWEIVDVKTSPFEKLFKSSNPAQYIGETGNIQVPKRYERLKELFASKNDIEASEVCIQMQNGKPIIKFEDGRHRYAIMRDLGLTKIPVAMDKSSIETAKRAGLL